MAQIILDKDLETEKVYEIDSFYEHITGGYCNVNKCVKVAYGSVFPFVPLPAGTHFSTIQLFSDDEIEIPILGTYNTIEDFRIDYHENEKTYDMAIVFINEEA